MFVCVEEFKVGRDKLLFADKDDMIYHDDPNNFAMTRATGAQIFLQLEPSSARYLLHSFMAVSKTLRSSMLGPVK